MSEYGARVNNGRAAVSNGARFFLFPVDERAVVARRIKDVYKDLHDQVSGGWQSLAPLTEMRLRRLAHVHVMLEIAECEAAEGKPIDKLAVARLTSLWTRLVGPLNLDAFDPADTPLRLPTEHQNGKRSRAVLLEDADAE